MPTLEVQTGEFAWSIVAGNNPKPEGESEAMTLQELESAIKVGRGGVCVDASRMDEFPSRVREVTVLRGMRVVVEFHVYGHDEGGPRYAADYSEIGSLVSDLETYLGKKLSDWENHTASAHYPAAPSWWAGAPSEEENARFRTHIASGGIRLPSTSFEQTSSYWSRVEAGTI